MKVFVTWFCVKEQRIFLSKVGLGLSEVVLGFNHEYGISNVT